MLKHLVDLVWSTILYHVSDLSRNLPRGGFTNHYHRDGGLDIDVSVAGIQHQVAGWARVITVYNVENRENHNEWWHGGWSVSKRFF